MSLTSLSFFCFFAITFGLYWLVRSNWAQKWLIIVASYAFYASFDYRFCLLLLATSLVGYVSGRLLEQTAHALRRKLILAAGLLVNLGVLAVFKYLGFFAEGAAHLLELLGLDLDPITLEVVLPVGISFYLFKIVSYLIDVYRGNIKAANDPTDVLLYAAFFPQLLSGPIERAGSFFPALLRKRTFEYPMAIDGARQMLWGLFKKLALADGLAVVVSSIMDDWTNAQGPELALGTVLFSFQIYCDFSGYTDISIGLSKLLGFKSMRNFAYPYFSQNVAEFWRRWNISVSSWFRDYVYIPLGGSRVKQSRFVFNVLATFLLSGLWHGANVTFIAWGAMLGLGVAFTSIRRKRVLKAEDTPGGERVTLRAFIKIVVTFIFISLSWVFFRSPSMMDALGILGRIFTQSIDYHTWPALIHLVDSDSIVLFAALVAFIIVEWLQRRRECALEWPTRFRFLRWVAYTVVFWLAVLLLDPGLSGDFLYYRF